MKRLSFQRCGGFTLLELLSVIAIIVFLAGMIIAGAGHAREKAARDRAVAEIAAMSLALEAYKADNGDYPRDTTTDQLNPTLTPATGPAAAASLFLYKELSGDQDLDAERRTDDEQKRYFEFKPEMLQPAKKGKVTAIADPFGRPYGYSTMYAALIATGEEPVGYNPTFDLWSTAGAPTVREKWITNW